MLSAQTKDQITFAAMENLKKYGLNVENILKTDEKKIGELIYPVGFWKVRISVLPHFSFSELVVEYALIRGQ